MLPLQKIKKLITQRRRKYLSYLMMVVLDTKSTKLKTLDITFSDTHNSSRSGCWTHMSTSKDIEVNGVQALPFQSQMFKSRQDIPLNNRWVNQTKFHLPLNRFLPLLDQPKKKKARQQTAWRHQLRKNKIYLIYLVIELRTILYIINLFVIKI